MSKIEYMPEKPLCKAEWKLLEALAAERDKLKAINEQLLEACQQLVGLVKMVEPDIVKALAKDYRHYVKQYLQHAEAAIAAAEVKVR